MRRRKQFIWSWLSLVPRLGEKGKRSRKKNQDSRGGAVSLNKALVRKGKRVLSKVKEKRVRTNKKAMSHGKQEISCERVRAEEPWRAVPLFS